MKRFKRKQKKLKEKQTARLIAESPLTCALDIWQARKEARPKAEYALSHEDFLMAEADLVHHLNRLKASTGLDEKKSELVEEQKETSALREFFEGVNGFGGRCITHKNSKQDGYRQDSDEVVHICKLLMLIDP